MKLAGLLCGLLACLLTGSTKAECLTPCKQGYIQRGDFCYKFFGDKRSHSGAVAECKANGDILVEPRTTEQDGVVREMLAENKVDVAWMGLSDVDRPEGSFVWSSDGAKLTGVGAWGHFQPNHWRGIQHCVANSIKWGGWNDEQCIKKFAYICQTDRGDYLGWTPWEPCSKPCGEGKRHRMYHCGNSCRTDPNCEKVEVENCNMQPCSPDGWVTDAPATFTEAQKRIMVEKHNHYRRMEKSSNMMRLEWDDDLAVFAQTVADRCKYKHTDISERKNLGVHANAGENIFASSASGFMTQEVVRGWWSEIEDYTFDTQACTQGKMCGHYTQVVWADSKALGCGVSRCDKLEGKESWGASYVVFCVYGPAGNVIGRQPFVKGDTCTQCPDGAKECGDGLCSPNAGNTAPVRQKYTSANEFCQSRQGPDSFACLQKKLYGNRDPEGDIICKQVFCAKNGNPEDCAYEFASYTDGLPCGKGKVCHHGVCEMDLTGAHDDIQDGCVHGDQGKVYGPTTGGIVTCDAVTAKDGTAACKADTFGRLCCSSCASILKDVDPNCPFGDEYGPGWCKRYESWICQCPTWKKSCCDFCKNRK